MSDPADREPGASEPGDEPGASEPGDELDSDARAERDRLIERWTRPTWGRRVAPVVLVAGLALALGALRHETPREQEITVRLEGPRGQVTSVELQVVDEAGETAAETRWSFPDGRAPGSVHGQARVKAGRWRVRVRVEGATPVHIERSLQLEGEPVSVAVKLET